MFDLCLLPKLENYGKGNVCDLCLLPKPQTRKYERNVGSVTCASSPNEKQNHKKEMSVTESCKTPGLGSNMILLWTPEPGQGKEISLVCYPTPKDNRMAPESFQKPEDLTF